MLSLSATQFATLQGFGLTKYELVQAINMSKDSEARKIADAIENRFNSSVDGKDAIREMRERGGKNWKQMEWHGFHTEEEIIAILEDEIGGGEGPKVGNTTIDYSNEKSWDIKSHPTNKKDGKSNDWAILNDQEAIETVIEEEGGMGFIIASGPAEFDVDEEFKNWHEEEKGGPSEYSKQRVKEGRPSRVRKKSIEYETLEIIEFNSVEDIQRGVDEGWAKGFQKDMRNADGSPRRSKIQIKVDEVPEEFVVERRTLKD